MRLNLNRRETYAVYGALCLVGLFAILQIILFPLIDKQELLQRKMAAQIQTIQKMKTLTSEYTATQKRAGMSKVRFDGREKEFTLFSFLDQLAGDVRIKDNITYMKPSSSVKKNMPYKISMVEMKLQAVTMAQLTSYMHKIETSNNMVSLQTVSISRTSRPAGYIDATLNAETFEKF
jgi:general secretion pathway protein M